MTHTTWLREAWSAADRLAHRLVWRLAATSGLVIIPRRQQRRTDSGFMLASILHRDQRRPAILVCDPQLLDAQHTALRERLAGEHVAVIDWCHPAPMQPAEITIITPAVLHRQHAALSGYRPQVIAILGARNWPAGDLAALRALMGAADTPLLIVEEWADPAIIAAAVGRIARVTHTVAEQALASWREDHGHSNAAGRPGDMARGVLARCSPPQLKAA